MNSTGHQLHESGLHLPKRWTPLKPHPEQIRLTTENKRFKVVPAGRRSGKTEKFKRELSKASWLVPGLYFAAAPTHSQAKKIFWKDLKALALPYLVDRFYDGELVIKLKNGSEIHVIGLDKPARFEGQPWTGGGIDEIADIKSDAWQSNISPALDTEGLDTWCWLLGVPDGLNHYYDMAQYALNANDPEWGLYTWPSSDILSPKKIEAAKRRLDPRTFRQEYEASFETATGRIYDDYSNNNHTDRTFSPELAIHWTHDFNFVPMSSIIIQNVNGKDYCVDEISLESAAARNVALEFIDRYKEHKNLPIYLYGDPSGKAGEKHGLLSNYLELERLLAQHGFNNVERRVLRSERSIRDSQASLRGRIYNTLGETFFYVNPEKCKSLDKGLFTTQRAKGSAYQEDPNNEHHHITTAARFFTEYQYPIYGKPTLKKW
jgi:hypothetical protein